LALPDRRDVRTFDELRTKRGEFVEAARRIVEADLESTGLSVDFAAISAVNEVSQEARQPEEGTY
jgi:uncharacterized membrane protein YqiK